MISFIEHNFFWESNLRLMHTTHGQRDKTPLIQQHTSLRRYVFIDFIASVDPICKENKSGKYDYYSWIRWRPSQGLVIEPG